MSDVEKAVKVGQEVPDFTLTVYQPDQRAFGKLSVRELKAQVKWTILFF